jgi:ADP-ribose pyrophosphatase
MAFILNPSQSTHSKFKRGWEDDPDKPAEDAARGELREETELVAGRMEFVHSMFIAYGLVTQRCNVFLATDLAQAGQQLDADEAGLICRAFPPPELERILLDGVIQNGVSLATFGELRLKELI